MTGMSRRNNGGQFSTATFDAVVLVAEGMASISHLQDTVNLTQLWLHPTKANALRVGHCLAARQHGTQLSSLAKQKVPRTKSGCVSCSEIGRSYVTLFCAGAGRGREAPRNSFTVEFAKLSSCVLGFR
jgi:hypothetical protein